VREKMQDGNRFNNLPQCSAIYVSSNYLPVQKEKMLNRILPIYFEPNMYKPEEMAEYYKEPHYLSKILPELLKHNFDEILTAVNATSCYLAQKAGVPESRESHNVAIACTGLMLLEQLGNYTISDKEEKLLEYFDWYLSQFRELEEPIDAFLNHLHVLLEDKLIRFEEHIWLDKEHSASYTLIIRTQSCLDKFNSYIGRIYNDKFIHPKEFKLSVEASPYYIETRNKRFKVSNRRIPPIASSMFLNITEYPHLFLIEEQYRKFERDKEQDQ